MTETKVNIAIQQVLNLLVTGKYLLTHSVARNCVAATATTTATTTIFVADEISRNHSLPYTQAHIYHMPGHSYGWALSSEQRRWLVVDCFIINVGDDVNLLLFSFGYFQFNHEGRGNSNEHMYNTLTLKKYTFTNAANKRGLHARKYS